MKKFLTITAFLCLLLACVSFGCASTSNVKSIALKDYSSETPLEITIGGFWHEKHTLVVTKEDNSTKEIALTETMISETDKLKFYIEGSQTITITYQGAKTNVNVNVSRKTFSNTVILSDYTAVYTGDSHVVKVQGDIPNGTEIIYPQGNVFINAGSYDMTAILQCDGYESKSLQARVVIEKAYYDVSNALVYNKTVTYNQDYQEIKIEGLPIQDGSNNNAHTPAQLPDGVGVSYTIKKIKDSLGNDVVNPDVKEGNRAIDAGVYEVHAVYKGDMSNYNEIDDSVAYLTINRATYDMSEAVMQNNNAVYTGDAFKVELGSGVELPNNVSVTYSIRKVFDGAGNEVTEDFSEGNWATNAGVYQVRAQFKVTGKNVVNYQAYPSETYATLTIDRANYDEIMENVFLDAQYFDYSTENEYSISLDGELPYGVEPKFIIKDKDGEVMSGVQSGLTYTFTADVGVYNCVVSFEHDDENYDEIEDKSTSIFIVCEVSSVTLKYDGTIIDKENPPKIENGTFDFAKVEVRVIISDVLVGLSLNESMIFEEEVVKLTTVGKQEIKCIYKGAIFYLYVEIV